MKSNIISFVLGATIGSLVTWKLIDKKYKKIADEEIEDVVEYYKNKYEEEVEDVISEEKAEMYVENMPYDEYKKQVEELEYVSNEEEEGVIMVNQSSEIKAYMKPYVITPEEYGEFGNETKSLTYYSDFVLADDEGEIIIDPEAVVGDALEHFGDYEDDAVHVRDENIECDYEILKDERAFSEVYKEEI